MLLHYLGKLKIQISCRYSADIAKMQTYCILIASNFVVHPQILIFWVFKIVSLSSYWFQIKVLSKSCPRRFIPCWLLRDTAVTSAVTNFRCHKLIAKVNKENNSELKDFICNQNGEWLAKLEAIKNAICLHFLPHLWKSIKQIRRGFAAKLTSYLSGLVQVIPLTRGSLNVLASRST